MQSLLLRARSDARAQAEAPGQAALGALTGAYEATRFYNKPPPLQLESVVVLGGAPGSGAEAAIARAAALARGNILALCGPCGGCLLMLSPGSVRCSAGHDAVLALSCGHRDAAVVAGSAR